MPYFSNDSVELYYELHGSGPALLLLAGLASDSQSWLTVLPELKKQYSVIVLDNRGVGRSSQECTISIDLMADDAMALLTHLGIEKVNLLGHSMGGMVAMQCAVRYPQMVEKLVLASIASRNPARNNRLFDDWAAAREADIDRAAWFRTIFAWIFTDVFFENSQRVDDAVRYLLGYPWPQSASNFKKQAQAIAAFDGTVLSRQIAVPTCVVAAEQDILMPLKASVTLADEIPGAQLVVIGQAAHSVHTEQPEAFVREVVSFLETTT